MKNSNKQESKRLLIILYQIGIVARFLYYHKYLCTKCTYYYTKSTFFDKNRTYLFAKAAFCEKIKILRILRNNDKQDIFIQANNANLFQILVCTLCIEDYT